MPKRIYTEGVPHHVFTRGIEGNFIFYNTMDSVFYVTLYYCLAIKHKIKTTAFSLMPNHIHSQQQAESEASFTAFNLELDSKFALSYNKWHNRSGALFDKFGCVPKHVGKTIKNNISYINNNGPVGLLSNGVLGYKWNLLSFYWTDGIFAEPECEPPGLSSEYKRAVKLVDYHHRHCSPLTYEVQERLYAHLNTNEKNKLINYILWKYNVVDFTEMIRYYGTFENAIIAMDANCGSEPEIQEDWEDYSVYREMLKIVNAKGYDTRHINFETMDSFTLGKLALELSAVHNALPKQVRKFLHLHQTDK